MAQEFIVSILDDENDGDFSADDLSLREAIALANDSEGADTITFDPSLNNGTITLIKDQPTGRPTLANTPLSITDSVTISGLGSDNLTIDGDDGGNGIFNIDSGDREIDVIVKNITIANGAQQAFSVSGLAKRGGSFFTSDNVTFTLQDSVITGSRAPTGGAIYSRGTTTIIGSTIENSSSTGDGPYTPRSAKTDAVIVNRNEVTIVDSSIENNNGSGIFNIGTLEVNNSNITNNNSIYAGGAIDNRNEVTIVGSNISGNSAPGGSAIRNTDNLANRYGNSLTISDSVIQGNTSTSSDNSAIVTEGTAFISNSTITDHDGGSNVGILVESGTLNIKDSTVSNNRADQAQAGIIVSPEATANISNSTIANNEARSNAGIENFGTVNLNNNTIANNTGGLGGGGIRNFGTANITSNLVANNTGANLGDISGDGETISGGNNLVGNANDVSGLADTDITDVDPLLGELQDNGGATQTIALLEDSPAIDAGSNPDNLTTDQRGDGFDRTVGDAIDIGAFEVQDVNNPDNPDNPNLSIDDIFPGTDGDDLYNGLGGNDLIFGGDGNDTLFGGAKDDTLSGGAGDDILRGGNGNDLLDGDAGNDYLFGKSGNDILIGGDGNDTLRSGDGNHILFGGHGDDIFVLSSNHHQNNHTIVDFTDGSDRFRLESDLSFDNLNIVSDESSSGVLILDTVNDNAVLAFVANVHVADINAHDFTNA